MLRVRWPEDPPAERPDGAGGAGEATVDLCAGGTQVLDDSAIELATRLPHDRRLHPAEHGGETADVVDVVVREDEQVDARDAESVEARRGGSRLAADIDHHHLPGIPDQESVSLTDIAGGDLPGRRQRCDSADQAAAENAQVAGCSQGEGGGGRGGEYPPSDSLARERDHGDGRQRCSAQQHAREAVRPGQGVPGEVARRRRDLGDPGGRQPGEPDQRLPDDGGERQRDAGEAAEQRGDGSGRRRQEVRDDPVERERRGEHDQDGLAGQQASWAASGTAMASARAVGIQRLRMRVSGAASTIRPAVASTDSAKP